MTYKVIITPPAKRRLDILLKNWVTGRLLKQSEMMQRKQRIVGKIVIVDGMYYELQDYESIFAEEMQFK